MPESELQELKLENQHLRDLVTSLSSILLRRVVTSQSSDHCSFSKSEAERLLHEANDCFRCAQTPGLKQAIAYGLEAAGHELMAKAVRIDTELQRAHEDRKTSSRPPCG